MNQNYWLQSLGKIGAVMETYTNDLVKVQVGQDAWIFNRKVVVLLAKSGMCIKQFGMQHAHNI